MNSLRAQALVLHTLAWRETSLIIEVLTRDHGRLGMVARGARRPRSALRGLLQPFQPLELRWSGKSELRNLISAEWMGGVSPLSGAALMSGFYLNELLVRLLPREDSHPNLFDAYLQTINALADQPSGATEHSEPILRRFECALLREMGYAPAFDRESVTGEAVLPHRWYRVSPQAGILAMQEANQKDEADVFSGQVLLFLAAKSSVPDQSDGFSQDGGLALQCKRLLRHLLSHHLGEEELQSREVVREMYRL